MEDTPIVQILYHYWKRPLTHFIPDFYRNKVVGTTPDKKECIKTIHKKNLRYILANNLWETPDPLALLYVRKCTLDPEYLNQFAVNLYMRFLTHPAPRLDFWLKVFNQFQKKGAITLENEVYQTVRKALQKGIWQKELTLPGADADGSNGESPSSVTDTNLLPNAQARELIDYRLNLIAEWLLSRYQVFAAWFIYKVKKNMDYGNLPIEMPSQWLNAIRLLIGAFACFSIIFGFFGFRGFSLTALPVLFIPLIVIWALLGSKIGWNKVFRLLLPVQLGAIIVGYFLLIIVGAEYWDLLARFIKSVVNKFDYFAVLTPIPLLLIIYFYLFWEIIGQLGYLSGRKAWKNAFTVLFIGCIESMVIGSVVFNVFGPYMQSLFQDYGQFLQVSHLCLSQAIFVATYMALALFVGIFLQIFWQDKPITVAL